MTFVPTWLIVQQEVEMASFNEKIPLSGVSKEQLIPSPKSSLQRPIIGLVLVVLGVMLLISIGNGIASLGRSRDFHVSLANCSIACVLILS